MFEPKKMLATSLVYPPPIKSKLPWWVEIKTVMPICTYYFGPFTSAQEAHLAQNGYIEDLMNEEAQGITVAIKQLQPNLLTIEQD